MTGLANDGGRVRILYDDRVARRETAIDASSAATPARRVGQVRPARKWRATGSEREVLWVDFGKRVPASHGALLAHNLAATGRVRWSLTDDPAARDDPDGADLAFDTTLRPWTPIHGFGFDPFGRNFGGYPPASGFGAFPARRVIDYRAPILARYLRVELSGPRMDAPVEVGRVLHGQGFSSNWNQSFGWQIRWVDPTEHVETEAGLMPAPAGRPVRELTFALDVLDDAERWIADDVNRIAARRRPVLVELFAGGPKPDATRTAVYGYFTEREPVAQADPLAHTAGWTVQELPDH